MTSKSLFLLSQLQVRFNPKEDLTSFLRNKIKLPKVESTSFERIGRPLSILKEIHYSWIEESFDGLPREIFVEIFEEKEREKLAKGKKREKISPLARDYLASALKKKVVPEWLLPLDYLPSSSLNALLDLTKEELTFLIDCLGLIDLSVEMRHVVEKSAIAKIERALSKSELEIVRYFAKQPIKWIPPKFPLGAWDGDRVSLFKQLHPRGLYRLTRAVTEENEHFLWYLTHKLDTGRGKVIEQAIKSEVNLQLIPYFRGQLQDLLERFKK